MEPGVKLAVLTVESAMALIMVLVTTILVPSVKLAVLRVESEMKSEMLLIMVLVTTILVPSVKLAVLTVESATSLIRVLGEVTNAVCVGLLGAGAW